MVEHIFYCGVAPPAKAQKDSRVLNTKGPDRNIELDPLPLSRSHVAEVPPRILDLIDIAAYVFAADRITSRGGKTGQGMSKYWRRNLKFQIAVRDLTHWLKPELVLMLRDLLGFMSEDNFDFEFTARPHEPESEPYFRFDVDPLAPGTASPVVLFSGGLDSLAGALDELGARQTRVTLVTHRSSDFMTGHQNALVKELKHRFRNRILFVPITNTLTGGLAPKEGSQRTRTFFFSAIAGAVANLQGGPGIRFYENGIMSLNLPLSGQVVGTAATRSTHPRTLAEMSLFLEAALGRQYTVDNPYVFRTKAEVLQVIEQCGHGDLIERTISCTEVRKRTRGCTHCGGCVQCLHRRFGVEAAGLTARDQEAKYALKLFSSPFEGDAKTMIVDLVRSARAFAEMSDAGFLTKYALELARIRNTYLPSADTTPERQMIDLHRRHGEQVAGVISDGLSKHKVSLARGRMPRGSLLTLVVGDQGSDLQDPHRSTQTAATPSEKSDRIQLSIDDVRNRFYVNGVQIGGRKQSVAVLAVLAETHREDRSKDIPAAAFRYASTGELMAQLKIDENALSRRVNRIRDNIANALKAPGAAADDRQSVIESKPWTGYRLHPDIRLVSPDRKRDPEK